MTFELFIVANEYFALTGKMAEIFGCIEKIYHLRGISAKEFPLSIESLLTNL